MAFVVPQMWSCIVLVMTLLYLYLVTLCLDSVVVSIFCLLHTVHCSVIIILICVTDLHAQKSMHFLCLEPRETDKNILKFTKNSVLRVHFLLLGPMHVTSVHTSRVLQSRCNTLRLRSKRQCVRALKQWRLSLSTDGATVPWPFWGRGNS